MGTKIQRWFMPWCWSRWVWVLLLPLALLTYFLSAVPVLRFASQRMKLGFNFQLISTAYRPVWIIDTNCNAAAAVIDWEDCVMDRILGLEGDWGVANPGGPFWCSMSQIDIERARNGSSRRSSKSSPKNPPATLKYWFDDE